MSDNNFKEYGGKPYGEIKCPFFTKQSIIPEELNRETICTKCWSRYDYNCYYPKFFDCSQYGEMLKTINPEYLKSLIDALRIGLDIEVCDKIKKEDNTLFNIVFKMADLWDKFLTEGKEVQVSITDAVNMMHFNKEFAELKKHAGYLKK